MNMVQQVTPVLSQLPDKWEIFLTDGSVSNIHGFGDSKILSNDYVVKITSNLYCFSNLENDIMR